VGLLCLYVLAFFNLCSSSLHCYHCSDGMYPQTAQEHAQISQMPLEPKQLDAHIPLAPLSANFAQIMSSFSTPSAEQILPKKKGRKPRARLIDPNPLDSLLPVLSDQNVDGSEYGQPPMMPKKRGRKPKALVYDPGMPDMSTGTGMQRKGKKVVQKKKGRKPKKVVRLPKIRFLVGGRQVDQGYPDDVDDNLNQKKRGKNMKSSHDQLMADEMLSNADLSMKMESPMTMDNPMMSTMGVKPDPDNSLKFDPELPMKMPSESLMDLFQNDNLRDMFQLENPLALEMMTSHPDMIQGNLHGPLPPDMTEMEYDDLCIPEDMENKRRGRKVRTTRKVFSNVGPKRRLESTRAHLPKKMKFESVEGTRKSPRQTKTKVFLDHVTF